MSSSSRDLHAIDRCGSPRGKAQTLARILLRDVVFAIREHTQLVVGFSLATSCVADPITVGRVAPPLDEGGDTATSDPSNGDTGTASGKSTDDPMDPDSTDGETDDSTSDGDETGDDDDANTDTGTSDGDPPVDGVYTGDLQMRARNLSLPGLAAFCRNDGGIRLEVKGGLVQPSEPFLCAFEAAPWINTYTRLAADVPADPESGATQGPIEVQGPAWFVSQRFGAYFGPGELAGSFVGYFVNAGYEYELEGHFFVER